MGSLNDPQRRQEDPAVKLALGLLRLSQAIGAAIGGAALEGGISPLQLRVLLDLAHSSTGAELGAAALAARYSLAPATMSVSLANLEDRGLLRRRADAHDARRRRLVVTASGRRLADRAAADLERLVSMTAGLGPERVATALPLVIELIRSLAHEGWIDPGRMCVTCRFFRRDHAPGSSRPHWCELIREPLAGKDLRVDCPEHEPASSP